MPNDIIYYFATDSEVEDIADAIREKAAIQDDLVFPDDFVSAIEGLPNTDESDATATAADIVQGKTAYIDNRKTTGTMPTVSADSTYGVSNADRTINGNAFLENDILIRGVTTSNIAAENIADGVIVKVGDSSDDDAIISVTGTHKGGSSGTWTSVTISGPSSNTSVSNGTIISIGSIASARVIGGIKEVYTSRTTTTPSGTVYLIRTSSTGSMTLYFRGSASGTLSANSIKCYYSYYTA